MSKDNFKHCLHQYDTYLCPLISPLIPFSIADCIVTLFTNKSLMTSSEKSKCHFSSYISTEPYSLLINSSLVISFQESVGSLLTCKQPSIKEEIFTGSIFILQPSCKLLSNNFQFHNPSHMQKKHFYYTK